MTIPTLLRPPPILDDLRTGTKLFAGRSRSTILADLDFETRSEAGFVWDETSKKFKPLNGSKRGLKAVGISAYSEHPSTEVICLAYNLKDGFGARRWKPGEPAPLDLFFYLQDGGIIEAWNVAFEYYIWVNVCMPKYLFPPINPEQLRCAAAKSRAYSLPGSLDACGEVLNIKNKKLKDGKRLLTKYSQPRQPTKNNPSRWNNILENSQDLELMQKYNDIDIKAESELSIQIPDLSPFELEFWKTDQRINRRGVKMDKTTIDNCIRIVDQAFKKYNAELFRITNGKVDSVSKVQAIRSWMTEYGVYTDSLDAEHISQLLKISSITGNELPQEVRRVLEIRNLIGSAAIKKLFSMTHTMSKDGRVRDLFIYHTARTGRAGGDGVQPQNLPNNNGLFVNKCEDCGKYSQTRFGDCPWCGQADTLGGQEWKPQAIGEAIEIINTGSLPCLEYYYQEPVNIIAGCLRGMFIADNGKMFISSDYSSIEAIVLACIAQENWHLEVYRTHSRMYEMTASKISGVPLEEFIRVKKDTGQHHPLRKLGKVASLASGYQGWLGAWIKFKADEFLSEEEMKTAIMAWRNANPNIVRLWKELETASHMAVNNPGKEFGYNGIIYKMQGNVLYCELYSGRFITYHRPRLTLNPQRGTLQLTYEGWNTNPQKGQMGWCRMATYGGALTENICQAVSRDILANAIVNLENRGYPVVLHVHDEIVCEVPEDFGSVAELEAIMGQMPEWASDWPIKASGGWRAKRYQK